MAFDEAEKAHILSCIERLKRLIADLEHLATSPVERAKIRDRMTQELEAARLAIIQGFSHHDPV